MLLEHEELLHKDVFKLKIKPKSWFEKFLLGISLFLYSDCPQNWYGGSLGEYPESFFLFFDFFLQKSCGLSKMHMPPILVIFIWALLVEITENRRRRNF